VVLLGGGVFGGGPATDLGVGVYRLFGQVGQIFIILHSGTPYNYVTLNG
jgi:hypothetical protein